MKKTLAPAALCLAALLLTGAAGKAPPPERDEPRSIAEWEDMHQQSLSTDEGKKYEASAIEAFWGDRKFMSYCVPEGGEAAALLVYFQLDAEGKLEDIAIDPPSTAAHCIKNNVAGHSFPPPPGNKVYVGKIDLQFQD